MCLCHTSFSHFLLVLVYSSVICKRLFLLHLDCTDFSHIPLCMSSSVSHRGSTFLCMLYNVCIVYYNGLSLLTSLSFLKMKKEVEFSRKSWVIRIKIWDKNKHFPQFGGCYVVTHVLIYLCTTDYTRKSSWNATWMMLKMDVANLAMKNENPWDYYLVQKCIQLKT